MAGTKFYHKKFGICDSLNTFAKRNIRNVMYNMIHHHHAHHGS